MPSGAGHDTTKLCRVLVAAKEVAADTRGRDERRGHAMFDAALRAVVRMIGAQLGTTGVDRVIELAAAASFCFLDRGPSRLCFLLAS